MAKRQKTLGPQIKALRAEGKSYVEIEQLLGCRRSTISYYCGEDQKKKTHDRQKKLRSDNPMIKKLDNFKAKSLIKSFDNKASMFNIASTGACAGEIKSKVLMEMLTDDPTCYLTGRPIDVTQSEEYHLDHIVPASKGGNATWDNLGIACRQANQAKHDMLLEEFFQLCADVINHNKLWHLIKE